LDDLACLTTRARIAAHSADPSLASDDPCARSLDDMVADIARDTMKAGALPKIVNHIRDYHLSLDKRLNGDVAANDCHPEDRSRTRARMVSRIGIGAEERAVTDHASTRTALDLARGETSGEIAEALMAATIKIMRVHGKDDPEKIAVMAAGFALAIAEIERTISPKFGPLVEHLQERRNAREGRTHQCRASRRPSITSSSSTAASRHGGFADLLAARTYAHDQNLAGWDIWHGNARIEQHDPLRRDPARQADPADLRREGQRCTDLAQLITEPRLRSRLAAMAITYFQMACELERTYALMDSEPEPQPL
jgi:hypothetical protein